jgi:DNA-binding XRE family transcriptional regulator
MGRLSKAKIDRIQNLRKKGYLQKEVAQMVGVNIKTVRAYDPLLRTPKTEAKVVKEPEEPKSNIELYKDLVNLANWVTILSLYLPDDIHCPNCLFPPSLKPKRKPKTVVLKVLENGDYKCPECGTVFVSPPQLAWRLLVREVAEELRREGRLPAEGEAEG